MGDAYWRYNDTRHQSATLPPLLAKRPRTEYDLPSAHEMAGYYSREDDRNAQLLSRDSDTISASYDRYLRSSQMSSYGVGDSVRSMSGGLSERSMNDPRMMSIGGSDQSLSGKSRTIAAGGGRQEISLPPDASNTLFVEGLPANCTGREVSHIFRPFVGYKEVRLVTKPSRHHGGDPLVLCFVDFESPAHAATALDALQGLRFWLGRRVRKYLVEPGELWWPSNLVMVSLFRALHDKEKMSKHHTIKEPIFHLHYKMQLCFPGYLFSLLTSLSWICWASS